MSDYHTTKQALQAQLRALNATEKKEASKQAWKEHEGKLRAIASRITPAQVKAIRDLNASAVELSAQLDKLYPNTLMADNPNFKNLGYILKFYGEISILRPEPVDASAKLAELEAEIARLKGIQPNVTLPKRAARKAKVSNGNPV